MKKLSKLLLALSFVLSVTTSAFAVTVVSWGGAYTESQKLGYGDPTAAKLGIPVDWVDYTGGLSEIKAQKEAGKITWDIMDVYAKDTIIGCDEGIFHEFDFDKDFAPAPDGTPASQDFCTSMPSKCAVGNILYSWNFAYNDATIGDKKPTSLKDFFNTKKFPGKRAIYKGAMSNLEIAITADGVNPGKGSDLTYRKLEADGGIDRAMNKLKALCTDPNGGHRRRHLAQLLLQHPTAIGAGKRSGQGLSGRGIAITAQLERDVQANRQLHQIVELAGIRRPMGEEEARQLQGRKVASEGLFSRTQQLPKPMQGLIRRPGRQPSLPALIRQARGQLRQGLQRRHGEIQFQAAGGQPLLAQQLHQRLKLLE